MKAAEFTEATRLRRIVAQRGSRPAKRMPRQNPPDLIGDFYAAKLLTILARAKALVDRRVLPALPALVRAAANLRGDARADAGINDDLDAMAFGFFEELNSTERLEQLAESVARRTEQYQGSQLQAQVRAAIGVDVPFFDRGMRGRIEGFVSENVALIKSVPSRYFDDVEKTVTRGVADGVRWEDIAEEMEDRYGVSESSAKLIARDQVGKFYGDLNEARQTALGIEAYVWRTVKDNRVREEHAELEGQRFLWSDEPEDGHPGEAVNCRCWAEPDLSDVFDEI